jgi:cation:H+ antiporter
MEEVLREFFARLPWSLLAASIALSLYVLARAADRLVDEVVVLSERSGVPKVVIGATVVSLGTTTPEAAVSVAAALQGSPGLAMGNAVGSIICDTGLILGLAAVMAPLKLDREIVNRQGLIQVGSAGALVLVSFPWLRPGEVLSKGGQLSQGTGLLFLVALVVYLWVSISWVRDCRNGTFAVRVEAHEKRGTASAGRILLRLLIATALVILSARVLIPAVAEASRRLGIAESVIAATLVAFGTSLPELVTAVTSARRGHGEIAVGNIVGADILNVLFVSGAAAAVTPGGLHVGGHFFMVLYPTMIFVLAVFRLGIWFSGPFLGRAFGVVLLAAYLLYLVVSYLVPG